MLDLAEVETLFGRRGRRIGQGLTGHAREKRSKKRCNEGERGAKTTTHETHLRRT
jgi:hypothetical protein